MGNYCNNRSSYARSGQRYAGRHYNGCQSCETAQPMTVTDCGCEARMRDTDCGCEARTRDYPCGCQNAVTAFTSCPDQVLAMAYVPFQTFGETYDVARAFVAGTLFPELDKPFKGGRCV